MPRHRALLWTLWIMFGPLLLMYMTFWNGWPLPYEVPLQRGPLAVIGFLFVMGFVYLLPIWLLWTGRQQRSASESSNAPNQ